MSAGEPPTRATLDKAWDLTADNSEVAPARHYIRGLARQVLGHGERADDLELAASEVLTNAVMHGGGHTIAVKVFTTGSALRVEVRDSGRSDSPHIPDAPINDNGRGLTIVEAFTDRWGAKREADHTLVWFEVDFEISS